MTAPDDFAEHKFIWLSPVCAKPICQGAERTWCKDPEPGPCDECGREMVKYVLASAVEAKVADETERVLDAVKCEGR